jgi:cytochrome b561
MDPTPLISVERYNAGAIVLHWLIALLILANWPLGYFHDEIRNSLGWNSVSLHQSLGFTVLLLSFARLAWRIAYRPPALPASIAPWRAAAARFTYAAFYVLMVAVPITGWMRSSAGKGPLTFFGLFTVPKFAIQRGSPEAAFARVSHEWLGWAILLLAILHVAAALHHHFRLRDALLLRMVPGRRATSADEIDE